MPEAITRTNLMLDLGKVAQLRRAFQVRSNSEAVRRAVEEALVAERGLDALRSLRESGGLEDVFGRAPVNGRASRRKKK